MRRPVDAGLLERFMAGLGREAHAETTCYLSGGATAVFYGWRGSTRDIDVKFVPDRGELDGPIARLKERLEVNVEQASPADFIPLPDGWEERSPLVRRERRLSFRMFDLYSQALAKLERLHARDLADVQAMLATGHVEREQLWAFFEAIEPRLSEKYAVDPASFRRNVSSVLF
jgi:hypothetical protein